MHRNDGWCGAPVTMAFVIEAHDLPLQHAGSVPCHAALVVCDRHIPAPNTD